jgi:hypothetical protein
VKDESLEILHMHAHAEASQGFGPVPQRLRMQGRAGEGGSQEMRREEAEQGISIPLRRDGMPKRFWYDPDYPGHIMYRQQDLHVRSICVAH